MIILPISKRTIFAVVFAAVIAAAACAGFAQSPPSLYEPSLRRELSKEERWALDAEMMNQIGMKHHNSRRFEIPEPYEERAKWFESVARWYLTADLLQQLVDFRRSSMRESKSAYSELIARGKTGDVGSTCFAAALFHHFEPAITAKWRVRWSELVDAVRDPANVEHPVCVQVLADLYIHGGPGVTPDPVRAKEEAVKAALAGSFGYQMLLAGRHLEKALQFEPRDVALNMCWRRVADRHSTHSGFENTCEAYRHGVAVNMDGGRVALPTEIKVLAARWCEPGRAVLAEECARLEIEYDKVGE